MEVIIRCNACRAVACSLAACWLSYTDTGSEHFWCNNWPTANSWQRVFSCILNFSNARFQLFIPENMNASSWQRSATSSVSKCWSCAVLHILQSTPGTSGLICSHWYFSIQCGWKDSTLFPQICRGRWSYSPRDVDGSFWIAAFSCPLPDVTSLTYTANQETKVMGADLSYWVLGHNLQRLKTNL